MNQNLNIDGALIREAQIGQAGRDLHQIQYLTVNESFSLAKLIGHRQIKPPSGKQEYRFREVLLNKVKQYWIKGVLEKSLYTQGLIDLGLEERLDAVKRPSNIVQEIPNESGQTLPEAKSISDVFNQMGKGRTLLILGEPGAGKTITLLKLAQELIARTEKDLSQPIPVVLNLSSWGNKQQTIADWLIEELNSTYQISKALGKVWIEDQQLLLLLDGLDEVKIERRESCIQAINQFMQEHGLIEIVVTSRIQDYQALSTRLELQGAICIQSLTFQQVKQYLDRAGEQLEAVKTLLQEDTTLQELAKSPLTLSVMTLAYKGKKLEDLPNIGSKEECRKHLFDTYIERMFKRRKYEPIYSKVQAMRWLIWLAQQMFHKSQTVFLLERIQPISLSNRVQKILYKFANFLIGVIICGLIGWQIHKSPGALIGVISAGLPLAWSTAEIKPVETLRWSWQEAKNFLKSGLPGGLLLGLIVGLFFKLVKTPFDPQTGLQLVNLTTPELLTGLQLGLLYGLIDGLILGLLGGLRGPEIVIRTIPNQGIWNSAKNALIMGLIGGLLGALFGRFIGEQIFGKKEWLQLCLVFGLVSGLVFGGGQACLQHFTLRLILYTKNCIPRNYVRFLDYATEHIFLQKVGGSYIFIHRMLLEHFAQMEPVFIQPSSQPIHQSTDRNNALTELSSTNNFKRDIPSQTPIEKNIVCTNCSCTNPVTFNFCTKCGRRLNQSLR
ncbi:NACHT domain-containing protein [Nostoc sp. CHAB 5784]|uniref:NACHT domain-containing protein n=1 Tax=Nostoc mirabile TaxID=2907820 RepID=UPI001E516336|nr:NACHT domain-containing protein [Nostoc mirabile]MCC5666661.1 NACHT domain-containing protein [Nostoc mirabile CHAB5784]